MSGADRDQFPGLGIYKRFFARHYDSVQEAYEVYIAPRKQALFVDLSGTVVEIGPGTGANLSYLPRGCRWVGIEPNRYMHAALRRRAELAGVEAEFRAGSAERIDLPDGFADVAVSTLVLCSVPDMARTLAEIHRVLKPGGRFLLIEQLIGKSPGLRLAQWFMRPAWYAFGDGCRTNRDIGRAIRQAEFESALIEEFHAPSPPLPRWVAPHISGTAVR
jgi:ubiquinone/menaquinone biosynthesis C-methylase UbiE